MDCERAVGMDLENRIGTTGAYSESFADLVLAFEEFEDLVSLLIVEVAR